MHTTAELQSQRCQPCEGGIAPLRPHEAQERLSLLDGWELTNVGRRIRKDWQAKNFLAAIEFFGRVAALAEDEGHHPDLHLESYRHVWIELWTHAIGGLSENDFILAAKIDQLPIERK